MLTQVGPIVYYVIVITVVGLLVAALPFSVWYYIKAKQILPTLKEKEKLEGEIESLRGILQHTEDDLKENRQKLADANQTIAFAKNRERWLADTEEETKALVVRHRDAVEKMTSVQKQKDDLASAVSEKQKELADTNTALTEVGNAVAAKIQELADVKLEISVAKSEKSRLEQEVADRRAEYDRLDSACKFAQERLAKLETDIDRRTKALTKEMGDLNGVLDSAEDRIHKIAENIPKQGKRLRALETDVSNAQSVLDDYDRMRSDANEKWKNLDMPYIKPSEESEKRTFAEMDERAWLEEFSDKLELYGFKFHERAIRAFHTGLKCAQTTPLVVLAGISGTGKSLLPELYATALGMNFLSVPIQPRWDSPQDLFGFYNYMEGRYKATELARLLWQYDVYNHPNYKAYDSANKRRELYKRFPLNLVLLDEMNLARVEYYFSDMLSKLETRNGLDADVKEERKKAEIELECNAADRDEAIRHLFVSPNTLFVGTMNEDESTQTLSDKVIDRSNVLRFGRPKTLNAKPQKSNFMQAYAEGSRLSVSAWQQWTDVREKPKAKDRLDELQKILDPVAEALDKVDRPYGFRVDNAMKAYVLNYPGDCHEAIADQLEMKVLPKLNGLEQMHPAFGEVHDRIVDAIDKIRDDELQKAFSASCDPNNAFFKWRGIMR